MSFVGVIHNAKKCTVRNEDCWIASICRYDDRRFTCESEDVRECDTRREAFDWLFRRLLLLGEADPRIEHYYDDGSRHVMAPDWM